MVDLGGSLTGGKHHVIDQYPIAVAPPQLGANHTLAIVDLRLGQRIGGR